MSRHTQPGVYLLHFDTPYAHAQHYLGYADKITHRVVRHQTGQASPLTRAARKAGIVLILARTWPGTNRYWERKLHNQHNNRRLCPICTPHAHTQPTQKPYKMPKGYTDPF